MQEKVRALLYGHAIGDALGVPVEFQSRAELAAKPVVEMRGHGSYDVPRGSWSDDTSMTLALMDSMARRQGIDYVDIMQNFLRWMDEAAFTPTGEMFDIGRGTMQSLLKFAHGTEPLLCGGRSDYDNGNGSLMRIAPLVPYSYAKYGNTINDEILTMVHGVSALTHAHVRSQMACGIYVSIALELWEEKPLFEAVTSGLMRAKEYYASRKNFAAEIDSYTRLWDVKAFTALPVDSIKSSGYVVDTLEAVIYCLLTTNSYPECVRKAVNLGEDTDTVGAITGGLAGLFYGLSGIPSIWQQTLLRRDLLDDILTRYLTMLRQVIANR